MGAERGDAGAEWVHDERVLIAERWRILPPLVRVGWRTPPWCAANPGLWSGACVPR